MSQRQQQQSAVQHAVRQALSPVSSLRRSSTTYTAGTGELGQSESSTATPAAANHICRPQHSRPRHSCGAPLYHSAHFGWSTLAGDNLVHGGALAGGEVPSSPQATISSPQQHPARTRCPLPPLQHPSDGKGPQGKHFFPQPGPGRWDCATLRSRRKQLVQASQDQAFIMSCTVTEKGNRAQPGRHLLRVSFPPASTGA